MLLERATIHFVTENAYTIATECVKKELKVFSIFALAINGKEKFIHIDHIGHVERTTTRIKPLIFS